MVQENYFVSIRKYEKQRLLDFIKKHKEMKIKKILALFSLQTGLKVTTLETYLRELKDAELIGQDEM